MGPLGNGRVPRPRRAPPPPPPHSNHPPLPPQPQPDGETNNVSDEGTSFPVGGSGGDQLCAACELCIPPLYLCNACNCFFCDPCWARQPAHRAQQRAPNGIRHDKTDLQLAQIMDNVFFQPMNERSYRRLFYEDRHTSWFGVKKDGPRLIFLDHGRYGEVMAKTSYDRSSASPASDPFVPGKVQIQRTPSLVSFVGQTGAGKSTLVKLLIDLQHRSIGNTFPAPVIGMPGKDVPTSEGVHLYLDPGTAFSTAPLLYADCEGLDGGEREPIGERFRQREGDFEERHAYEAALPPKTRYTSERELMWADSPFRRSRDFVVSSLYPRLLYTFSDVIIFVLRNPRVIESVFEQLIDWAAVALETSSNQPALPHAIILLNGCELDVDDRSWDVETATRNLLDALSHTINLNPTFQKYAQYWEERNKDITTVEELMMCYYSSLKIVRMPQKSQPQLVETQTDKLYQEIQAACTLARNRKAELRMLLDAGELQSYLQFAFAHFSARLDVPFDFVQASFLNNPIPSDFGGSILKLAIRMMEQEDEPDARVIFGKLSCMVASCIMLDSVRHKIKGNADSIFPLYLQHLEAALKDFCDRHWPCDFAINRVARGRIPKLMFDKSQTDETTIMKCVNVRSGHGSKGHQLADGRVFAAGDYVSDFTFEKNRDEFLNMAYFRLEHLLTLLTVRLNNGEAEIDAAKELHRDDVMAYFYGDGPRGGVRSVHSHSVCFCCLFEAPEHCLPCGHILCTACIKTYGKAKDANTVEMYECPLETNAAGRYQPWTVHLKPQAAGLRVLCLDSGGVRNVIQLEILRLLERELNGKLPIQYFFDLIVGSGTSSLIALGLGARNWSIEECLDNFEKVCTQAFANRAGRHVPGAGWLVESLAHAKYDNVPLEGALKEAFPDGQYLFGGPRHRGLSDLNVKVALAASSSGGNGVVLANYNRQPRRRDRYQFYRSENLAAEFKTWEAARACMATPRLFKPLQHLPSRTTLLECGLHSQNPVHIAMNECRALLPESITGDYHPDIVLSLGAGIYSTNPSSMEPMPTRPARGFGVRGRGIKVPEYQILMAAHCQKIWDDHMNTLSGSESSSAYVRLNFEISEGLSSFESHDSMKLLRNRVEEQYKSDGRLKRIAAQLVATLFYFESSGPIWDSGEDAFLAKGRILCRLPNETPEVREVGRFLRARTKDSAHFLFAEDARSPQYFAISEAIVNNMIRNMVFELPPIQVRLSSETSIVRASLLLVEWEQNSISGFPRSIVSTETANKRRTWGPTNARPSQFIQARPTAWKRPEEKYSLSLDISPLQRSEGGSSTSSLNLNRPPRDRRNTSPAPLSPESGCDGRYLSPNASYPSGRNLDQGASIQASELADTSVPGPRIPPRPRSRSAPKPPQQPLNQSPFLRNGEGSTPSDTDASSDPSRSIAETNDSSTSIEPSLSEANPQDFTERVRGPFEHSVEFNLIERTHRTMMSEMQRRGKGRQDPEHDIPYTSATAPQSTEPPYIAYSPPASQSRQEPQVPQRPRRPTHDRHDSKMEPIPEQKTVIPEAVPQRARRPAPSPSVRRPPPPVPKKREDLRKRFNEGERG
ncbi:hypothetical protein BCR34DRAFT_524516 [Clohesyomyces aquaticus]|uniref:PNPLA domain-containing protein n=1 Tax=Clohesyomyces aquaticus TaxID=1231657 RepID=A0A1Y1YGW3_9PLEO|nr:hypothetical protein BCR34DRAFT_524516 [Clohesyomyces aquaticus]